VPALVDRIDELRILVLTHLSGEPADASDPALHEQAGRALAVLHGLPIAIVSGAAADETPRAVYPVVANAMLHRFDAPTLERAVERIERRLRC